MLGSMAGYDPQHSTSIDVPVPDYRAATGRSVKGLRVGIPKEYRVDGMPGEIDALWRQGEQWFRDAGAEIVEISLPHTQYALATYTSSPRPNARPISPAMTACATACACPART